MTVLRYACLTLLVGALGGTFYVAASGMGQSPVSAQRFVDLQQGGQPHVGFRRAHAKGFCVVGEFRSSGALTPYTTAMLFQPGRVPFTGRISVAGNDPTAPDLKSPVRSLALSFGDGDQHTWRTAMNTPPVMAVGTPEAFFEQLQALSPDPQTGQRDPQRIRAFFAAHPETLAFLDWQKSYRPTPSFATERYHSINAFYLVNQQGQRQAVRWVARPVAMAADAPVAPVTPATDDPNALRAEFMGRVAKAPVVYDLVFILAAPEDKVDDPTQPWPAARPTVVAGQLFVQQAFPEEEGGCKAINFDPLILPRGMLPSGDPILRARSAAYAESFRRRARESL